LTIVDRRLPIEGGPTAHNASSIGNRQSSIDHRSSSGVEHCSLPIAALLQSAIDNRQSTITRVLELPADYCPLPIDDRRSSSIDNRESAIDNHLP
jgi:hypothetical protein